MHVRRRSKLGFGLALTLLVALVLTGCSGSTSKSAKVKPAPAPTTSPPTTTGTPVVAGQIGVKVIPGSATGTSPCEKAAPVPSSPGEVGAGGGGSSSNETKAEVAASEHGERGMVVQQTLTKGEREALEAQITTARQVAVTYPTVKDALAAGYMMSTPFVPCIGAHYTNIGLATQFDPAKPSELLYDGTTPNSKIVGLSYLVWHPGGPPPGFAGSNDHWHQHNANGGLCLRGGFVIGGEETSRQECADLGGRKSLLIDVWMLHAWIVPGFECSWGTFSGECPELGGRICGNAWQSPDPKDDSQCSKALTS